jgi:TolB-like protein/class 3 adenylate cyclase/Tfp pilus assembly protein PilF
MQILQMSQSRQLAAIMFTDIVGYTALMGEDEQRAFNLLNKNRQLQRPQIEGYGGKWIKELGDGVLASFSTVTDAVNCACSIVKACEQIEGLKLRIGIHQGEVIFENNDVFGNGVNIASRLQALAPIGSIWISESVYKNIANKKEISTRFVRQEILKNVKEPVQIYEVIFQTMPQPLNSISKASNKAMVKSVAVLPFLNISNDPEQEYFSDGMAEEIINSLSHLKDLKVAGRSSSFQFKGKNIDLREVGEKLGVRTVLEGSVRKQGNRLCITAQLINVEDGFHFWSEKYDRNLDDIFAIQDEIALAITEQLKITLLDKERELITKNSTHNAEAYELYLKGRFHTNRRGSSILTGLQFFKQAIAVDPGYALAYAGYADACLLSAFYSFLPAKEVKKEIKQAIETGIRLDNSLGEAYCSLGLYYPHFEWNWTESKKSFIKAIELNPKYVQAYSWYGMVYLAWVEGQFDEAETQGRIAIKLEPLSAIDHADLSWTLYTAQRFEEALAVAKTGIDLDANSFLSQRLAGLCYLALKRYEEAIDTFRYLIKISNRHQHALTGLIWAYCSNGNIKEAKELMYELEERSVKEYIAGTYFGLSSAYLGDLDKAFDYLERAYDDRDPILVQLKFSPAVPATLRNDPRFQNLLDRVGFPK